MKTQGEITIHKPRRDIYPASTFILDFRLLELQPPHHVHGDLTSLAPHERLPELPIVLREKPHTGSTARENQSCEQGLLSSCSAWAYCSGFSSQSAGSRVLGLQ